MESREGKELPPPPLPKCDSKMALVEPGSSSLDNKVSERVVDSRGMKVEQGPKVARPDLWKMKAGGELVTAFLDTGAFVNLILEEIADLLQQHYE